MTDTIFSLADIQKLIVSFPPPEPRPGKTTLLRSFSGSDLVRSDAVLKRFSALLESSQTPVLVSSLPRELGVQEVQWLLTQEPAHVFFSRDRQRLLPKIVQKSIITSIRDALEKGAVNLDALAMDNDLTTDTLRRMLSQDTHISLVSFEDGTTFSDNYLTCTREKLQETLSHANGTVVNLSKLFSQIPDSRLQKMAQDVLSDETNGVEGLLQCESNNLQFTPQSAVQKLKADFENARGMYIKYALTALETAGYCNLEVAPQPEILQKELRESILDFCQSIKSAHAQTHKDEVHILDLILVRGHILTSTISDLAVRAEANAIKVWDERVPGEDVSSRNDFSELLVSKSNTPSLDASVIRYHEEPVVRAFEQRLAQLQESTVQQFTETLQSQLLCPFRLYSQGLETITDNTLQPRVSEFVRDWARRELVPEVLSAIKEKKLIATKATLREVEKFTEAVQSARNMDEVSAAMAKLVRKLKIEQPDTAALATAKRTTLNQKLVAMRKMKRGSSLLQNLTWILLATSREGLYMSAGKDTSRVIKLYQTTSGDAEIGKKLGELRDLVKEDKDTDKEREEMRSMAQAALATHT
ncbi:hypothetical protein MBLNU459_g6646t1 [Dothideomycetes sp. NU459]